MKGLPPSLKSKKRYIAFELISENSRVSMESFTKALVNNMLSLFGETSTANCGINLEIFNGKRGIIRCSRDAVDKVIIALTLINSIGDVRVVPLTIGVSGTIKKCKKKYLEV